MSAPAVTYTPGRWLAVIRPDIWALIDVTVDDPRVNALWEASAEGLDELLDVLLRGGLRLLPGFVIVATEGADLRYAIRSPTVLDIDESDAERVIDAAEADSWVSGRLPAGPRSLTLRSGSAAGGVELPTAAGITSASLLKLNLDSVARVPDEHRAEVEVDTAPLTIATEDDSAQDVPPEEPTPPEDTPSSDPSEDPTPASTPGEQSDPTVANHASTYFQLLSSSTMERDALLSKLNAEDDPGVANHPHHADPEAGPVAADQRPTSEATGVWNADLEEPPQAGDEALARSADAGPGAAPEPGGVIDGLPWQSQASASQSSAEPAAPPQLPSFKPLGPATPDPHPDNDPVQTPETALPQGEKFDSMSVTISRAALRKQLEEEENKGPTILALRCQHGHLSPTYAATCRVCGTELQDQNPVEVTRPALGTLALSDGSTVVLDKGVIFGRFPQSEVEDPAQRPNLVRLIESAEISRMHASIMLDGWQVLLRDLGSQNGTILTLPGHEPEQIRSNEDYVLEPGSVVSFADVVSCTFEVTE
jgi:hypothetical protein